MELLLGIEIVKTFFISNFGFNGAFVVIVVAFYSYYLVLCSA